jgi:hypothetical protein
LIWASSIEILDILFFLLIPARQLLISGIVSGIVSSIISIIEIIIQDRFLVLQVVVVGRCSVGSCTYVYVYE